jgi:Domain of unknown function (DUF758)
MTDNSVFRAKDVGLRTQKKILSRMASKNIAKMFIDENTASLLDNIYTLIKQHTGSKKVAERLVKNVIKIVIKIAVLSRNNQFSADETQTLNDTFRKKFNLLQMTVISFYEVDFSFDMNYLQNSLNNTQTMLKNLVQHHLSEKSISRIDEIYDVFKDQKLLEMAFRIDSPYKELMGKIVHDLNKAMDFEEI